jgi:hypothetical protein
MYRARYPDFDSSGRLDRALRVLVVASIAVLLGTVVGGASVFAIVSALNTPPRHEARADSRTASEAALAGGPVIKRLSPNSAAPAASPAPAPDASTATSTTPVQPETPPLQATRPGGIQAETPKPRDSTASQAVDSATANNRANRSSRNWQVGQRRAIVTARPAGPSASANRQVPPREADSNEIGARAAAASQERSLWNYSGRGEYWREGQAKEATHSMARRVSRKVPSQPEYAEQYDVERNLNPGKPAIRGEAALDGEIAANGESPIKVEATFSVATIGGTVRTSKVCYYVYYRELDLIDILSG